MKLKEIINELGPKGGRHPGRKNQPKLRRTATDLQKTMAGWPGGSEESLGIEEQTGYEIRKVHKFTKKSIGWLQYMKTLPIRNPENTSSYDHQLEILQDYLPLYFVFKDREPYLIGSPRNRDSWFLKGEQRLRDLPYELVIALDIAGVPEEMIPDPK
jgi:hypothetical protein